jgi:hypothetical protein
MTNHLVNSTIFGLKHVETSQHFFPVSFNVRKHGKQNQTRTSWEHLKCLDLSGGRTWSRNFDPFRPRDLPLASSRAAAEAAHAKVVSTRHLSCCRCATDAWHPNAASLAACPLSRHHPWPAERKHIKHQAN